jgi:hypothetical protein
MKAALMAISLLALAILLLLPLMHACGAASLEASRTGMAFGTLGWFATAPFWMRHRVG